MVRLSLYKNELIIFFLGVAVSLALFSISYGRLGLAVIQWGGNDFIEYRTLAENFIGGHGFSLRNAPPFEPSAVRLPGYPLFLALSLIFTGGTVLASVLQVLLFSFFGVLAYWVLRELEVGEKLAMVVGALTIFEPDVASTGIYLISDTLFNVLLLASFLVFLKAYKAKSSVLFYVASVLLGVSAIVRPISLAVWGIYAVVWLYSGIRPFFSRRNIGVYLMAFLLAVIPVAPWVARNYIIFGVPKFSTADTYNLYTIIVPQIISLRDGISYREARSQLLEDFLHAEKLASLPEVTNVGYDFNRAEFLMLDNFRYHSWMRERFNEAIRKNPSYYAEAVARGTVEFFTQVNWLTPLEHWELLRPSYQPETSFMDELRENGLGGLARETVRRFSCGMDCVASFGLVALGRVVWAALTLFSIMGGIIWYRRKREARPLIIASALFVALIALLHIFFIGMLVQPRYRIPLAPFFIGFALIGARQLALFLRGYIGYPPSQEAASGGSWASPVKNGVSNVVNAEIAGNPERK